MVFQDLARTPEKELTGRAATAAVAALVGVLFAGSTLLTPLYVMYERQIGFSRITLTLIYAVYVIGNLAALLLFGRMSDAVGRRRVALAAMGVAIVGALVFLADNLVSLYVGRVLSGLAIGVGAGTGTAWLAELIGEEDKTRSTAIATSANFIGLAIGALTAGLLAQYAAWPLTLPFLVYVAALVAVAALVRRTQETVERPAARLAEAPLRPKISVPRTIRAQFVAPSVTGFGSLALVGFYAALAPSMLSENLHQTSHAVAGALFFELAVVVAGCIVVTQQLSSRAAMLWALALMGPSVVALVAAQTLGSMTVMIAATALCAVSAGLGYRGSLQVANQIAPEDKRAAVVSSYFICGFCGNALPVIGVGVLSTLASATVASLAFAGMIIVFAVVAFVFGLKYTR